MHTVVVFFTLTDRASTISSNIRGCFLLLFSSQYPIGPQPYPVLYVVANPVRGLLGRKRSEEHLPSSNESNKKTQTHKKRQRERNRNNKIHGPEKDGCQSGTCVVCWTEKDQRNIYQAPMRAKEKHKHTKNDNEKETGITKYTCQKKIDEGHSIERVWHSASRQPSDTLPGSQPCTPERVASTTFRTLRVSVFTNGTIDVA